MAVNNKTKTILGFIKKPIAYVIVILVVFFILKSLNIFPSFSKLFKSQPVLIDNTPLVIKEIKALAELNTASLYQEVVVDSAASYTSSNPFSLNTQTVILKKEIVLIIKGRVTAGINLKQLADSNIFVKNDSASILLPAASITDIFINPSGIETFYENGNWSNDELIILKKSARQKLLDASLKHRLLEKANEKARSTIETFLSMTGFKKITVKTKME